MVGLGALEACESVVIVGLGALDACESVVIVGFMEQVK